MATRAKKVEPKAVDLIDEVVKRIQKDPSAKAIVTQLKSCKTLIDGNDKLRNV